MLTKTRRRMGSWLDAERIETGRVFTSDVCIVGAGAAGMTLARKLSSHGVSVLLIESGSTEMELETQDLYRGKNVGLRYHELDECRLRYLGGTTNLYAGFCAPVVPGDLEPVPGVDLTDWPVTWAEMQPYFAESERQLDFAPSDFDPDVRLRREGYTFGEPNSSLIEVRLFSRLADDRRGFVARYIDELKSYTSLTTLLHANATHIRLHPQARTVEGLELKTLSGKVFEAKGRLYVLACHAIENARLLLASNDVLRSGIGNAGGFVGRCFMDHAVVWSGILVTEAGDSVAPYLDFHVGIGQGFTACLTLPRKRTDDCQCMQYFCRLRSGGANADNAFARLLNRWRQASDRPILENIMDVLRDIRDDVEALSRKVMGKQVFLLEHRIEQAPNPSSRVVLSMERDALGSPRADLCWALSDTDLRTFQAGQEAVIRYLGAVVAGRVAAPPLERSYVEEIVTTHSHHIGTTRMSETPRTGVVNADCRVHGIDNLYVAGSSVFCRPMFPPPTMAIVAFCLRLADHLRRAL